MRRMKGRKEGLVVSATVQYSINYRVIELRYIYIWLYIWVWVIYLESGGLSTINYSGYNYSNYSLLK